MLLLLVIRYFDMDVNDGMGNRVGSATNADGEADLLSEEEGYGHCVSMVNSEFYLVNPENPLVMFS